MNETQTFEQPYVFGLDIGTRNVVGTVGYKEGNEFVVVAQYIMQHETRAMIDGQIHDIGRVGSVIRTVKEELEKQIECPLTEVCIAAAGRVLKTVTTNVEYEYPEETVVTKEDIHTLDLLGIEKAQSLLKEKNDTSHEKEEEEEQPVALSQFSVMFKVLNQNSPKTKSATDKQESRQ